MTASIELWQRRQDAASGTHGPLVGTPADLAPGAKKLSVESAAAWAARG